MCGFTRITGIEAKIVNVNKMSRIADSLTKLALCYALSHEDPSSVPNILPHVTRHSQLSRQVRGYAWMQGLFGRRPTAYSNFALLAPELGPKHTYFDSDARGVHLLRQMRRTLEC